MRYYLDQTNEYIWNNYNWIYLETIKDIVDTCARFGSLGRINTKLKWLSLEEKSKCHGESR